jgi:hypothetical protein
MNITPILEITIIVILIIFTGQMLPWIKSKVSDAQRDSLDKLIETMVEAAEQIYDSDMGQQKLDTVVDWLSAKGYTVDIARIEAAVYRLKNARVLQASKKSENIPYDDELENDNDDWESAEVG